MKPIVIASKNPDKLAEIKRLLKGLSVKVLSLNDFSRCKEVKETGKTFEANARLKARYYSKHTRSLVLADDSGLMVHALNGRPGVYSARFAGEGATDEKNNQKLLRLLKGMPLRRRQARYRCFVALADGEKIIDVVSGSCSGLIAQKPKGTNGFGYDPLFLIPRYKKTFGELDPNIKAKISHRSHTLKKFRKTIEKYSLGRQ